MPDLAHHVLDPLRAAGDFEVAGRVLLRALCVSAEELLARVEEEGQVLRATLHSRPGPGYAALVHHEEAAGSPPDAEALVASTSAWAALQGAAAPLCLDVEFEGPYADAPAPPVRTLQSTYQRLRARDTTHVLVIPLCAPTPGLRGMVTVELACVDAVGVGLDLGPRWAEPLQRITDVAAAFLETLPPPTPTPDVDPWGLPVVGRAMGAALRSLGLFARTDRPLLLVGPTGCGKTLLAEQVHRRSSRQGEPFVKADLHVGPEDIVLAGLFGVVRGAFTGATRSKEGLISQAQGGTLFLDDVDSLPPRAQTALLRLLDEGLYRRLGDTTDRRADVRVISASRRDLDALVAAGQFREDLRFRLGHHAVTVPGLDQRQDELQRWANRFLRDAHADQGGTGTATLAQLAMGLLERSWPGNLRSLRSAMENAYLFAASEQLEGESWPNDVVVQRRHLELALGEIDAPASLLPALLHAARLFLRSSTPLSLDDCGAFHGAVVAVALDEDGDAARVAERFGFAADIPNGNHLKKLRRASRRFIALVEGHGGPLPSSLGLLSR
ncbi:MAG: sigma-54-dependent Fis family transcriptional regulator [Alphaproteobacteria bacterium]|nr:sigma-54-dependent Fis family transcriptional regulator [Alphaproteobacteria bacterium]